MKLSFGVLMLLAINACVDQISFNINENNNEYLIIDALIKDNDDRHVITIKINGQSSASFQADQPVGGATVVINSSEGDTYTFINNNDQGEYWNYNLRPEEGITYQLSIEYEGITYQSTSEVLLPSIPITDVRTLVSNEARNNEAGNVTETEFVNVFADSNLPTDQAVYLRYSVKGVYEYQEIGTQANLNPGSCWVSETIDLDNISLASNENLPTGELKNQFIIQRAIDYRYANKYCMKVYQERITETAHNFWRLVENEYSRTGDIFERPPGIIRGNIVETTDTDISASGLFSISAVDSFLHAIIPADVNSPAPQCQPFPPPPATCTNCLLLPRSTEIRPECFK